MEGLAELARRIDLSVRNLGRAPPLGDNESSDKGRKSDKRQEPRDEQSNSRRVDKSRAPNCRRVVFVLFNAWSAVYPSLKAVLSESFAGSNPKTIECFVFGWVRV